MKAKKQNVSLLICYAIHRYPKFIFISDLKATEHILLVGYILLFEVYMKYKNTEIFNISMS